MVGERMLMNLIQWDPNLQKIHLKNKSRVDMTVASPSAILTKHIFHFFVTNWNNTQLYKGIPSKLFYMCIKFDPSKNG